MRNKLTLDLDSLSVDTFATTDTRDDTRGTVHGQEVCTYRYSGCKQPTLDAYCVA